MIRHWREVQPIAPGVWRIDDGGFVAFFLIQGKSHSVVIDTGFGITDTLAFAKQYLQGPITLLNTHVHPDHSNGNRYFPTTMMGKTEWQNHGLKWNSNTYKIKEGSWDPSALLHTARFKAELPQDYNTEKYNQFVAQGIPTPDRLLSEGDSIDLGDTKLEVIETPSHTTGSLSFLDTNRRLIFVGDALNKKAAWWLHLKCRASTQACLNTYAKLGELAQRIDTVLPAHGEPQLPSEFLTHSATCMKEIKQGKRQGLFVKNYGGKGHYYSFGGYGPVFAEAVVRQV